MSILIKRMEMPVNCNSCMFHGYYIDSKGYCGTCRQTGKSVTEEEEYDQEKLPDDCPLIEVPKHGRLIDADKLEEYDGWLRDSMYFTQESGHTHIQFIYANDIINAPTIIEAEDGEP